MKKVKYLFFGLICMFCYSIVLAKDEVIIKSITPVYDKESSIVVTNENNNQAVTFNDKDQTIKYNVVLENTTTADITVKDIKLTTPSEDFLIYEVNEIQKDDVIKSKGTKEVIVTLNTIKKEGWGRNFNDELVATIYLDSPVLNPETNTSELIITLILIASTTFVSLMLFRKNKIIRYVMIAICLSSTLSVAKALYTITVAIKVNAQYESQNVMEKAGEWENEENETFAGVDYWNYREKIKSFNIANEFTEITDYEYKFDVSEKKNERVIAYLVENEDDSNYYDLYLQADGIIYPNTDSSHYFFGMTNLEKINNFSGLDTSEVTDMSFLFHATGYNIEDFELNLGNEFDTTSVVDMTRMFSQVGYNSETLNLTLGDKFNTSNVTNMKGMFNSIGYNTENFTLELNDNFDTSNVTDMYGMFAMAGFNDPSFKLDLGKNFNTIKVQDMRYMFNGTGYNSDVFRLDLGDKFDTSNVKNMESMFAATGYNTPVFTLDLGENFNTSNVTNMKNMFSQLGYTSNVFKLELGDNFDTSNVEDMSYMFNSTGYNSGIFTLDLGDKFDTSNVTNMYGMFAMTGYDASSFTLDLGDNFDTSNVLDMGYMFNGTGYNSKAFTLDLKDKFNTSKVTNMSFMFAAIGFNDSIFTLDLGDNFDTSNVENMSYMFDAAGYSSSKFSLDLGDKFNTSKVTNMHNMFAAAGFFSPVFTLDLGNEFNMKNVTDMSSMFYGTGYCSNIMNVVITISNPNTSYDYNTLKYTAVMTGSKLTVNYTAETSTLVNKIIATKSAHSNVVLGEEVTENNN